jgi:hypothetical protein
MLNFFRKGKKGSADTSEGLWLKGYRDSQWVNVFSHQTSSGAFVKTDVSVDSCYFDGRGFFCLLRREDESNNFYQFLAVVALPDLSEMAWIVERVEDYDGNCLRKDVWHREASFKAPKVPEIQAAISTVKSFAVFNNFSSPPPYMLIIALSGDKWMN